MQVAGEAVGVADVADHPLVQEPVRVDLAAAVEAAQVGRARGGRVHHPREQPVQQRRHVVVLPEDAVERDPDVRERVVDARQERVGGVVVQRLDRERRDRGLQLGEDAAGVGARHAR